MFTPQGIGSILLKFRSLLPLCSCCCGSSTTLVTFLFYTAHSNLDNISITFQVRSQHSKCLFEQVLCFQALRLSSQEKRCKKQLTHFTLTSCSVGFALFALHYQGCNTITLNPSLRSKLDVILMKQYKFDKRLLCNLSNQNENCFIYSSITTGARIFVWLIERDAEENVRQKTKWGEV